MKENQAEPNTKAILNIPETDIAIALDTKSGRAWSW
jgi:hypothetical protein